MRERDQKAFASSERKRLGNIRCKRQAREMRGVRHQPSRYHRKRGPEKTVFSDSAYIVFLANVVKYYEQDPNKEQKAKASPNGTSRNLARSLP